MKKLLVFILFGLLQISLQAQIVIKGKVTLGTEMAEGAMVTLMDKDTVSVLGFTITNEQGGWEFKLPKKGTYCLSVGYMGYETAYKKMLVNSSMDTVLFVLKEQPTEISVTEVRASKLAIMQNKDTVYYDIKQFMNGTEDKLDDVLKKLPGIEYGEDGSIKYKGKRIDNLMLEGRNIFSNMHKVMAEGVNALDVKTVKIISNLENNGQNDKTALDLELNEKNKRRWNGNISFGMGKDWRYKGEINLYRASSKSGTTLFLKTDGAGQDMLTMMDYIGLQPSMEKVFMEMVQNPMAMSEFNSIKVPQNGLLYNHDQFLNANHEQSLGNGKRLNGSLSFMNLNRKIGNDFLQFFYQDGTTYQGRLEETQNLKSLITNLSYKTDGFNISVPFSIKNDEADAFRSGRYNNTDFKSSQNLSSNVLSLSPEIDKKWKLNDSTSFRLTLKSGLIDERRTLKITDINSLFETGYNQVSILQSKNNLNVEAMASVSKKLKLGGWNNQLIGQIERQQITQNVTETNERKLYELVEKRIKYATHLMLKKHKSRMEIHGHIGIQERLSQSNSFLLPTIDFNLVYGYSLKSNLELVLGSTIKTQTASAMKLLDFNYINDQRNATTGQLPLNQLGVSYSFPLILNLKSGVDNSFLFNIIPSVSFNSPTLNVESYSTYLLTKNTIIPSTYVINSALFYMKAFSKIKTRSMLRCNSSLGKSALLINEKLTPTTYMTFSPVVTLNTDLIKNTTVGLNYSFDYNYQENAATVSKSLNHAMGLNLKRRFFKSLILETRLGYSYLTGTGFSNHLWNFDLEAKYQVGKVHFYLQGRNLTNWTARQQQGIDITATSYTKTSFQLYPATLLIGMEYKL